MGASAPTIWPKDHPRSRGVYSSRSNCVGSLDGSSPLARGLPWAHESDFDIAGIIPARAGFTHVAVPHVPRHMDHPRSRGVYNAPTTSDQWDEGSSPLARGLRHRVSIVDTSDRIIPARAGFTPARPSTAPPKRDHPRSRGVYIVPFTMSSATRGSSPLARGLPREIDAKYGLDGIIPARAGFTVRTAD